jgi:hypothetical protein
MPRRCLGQHVALVLAALTIAVGLNAQDDSAPPRVSFVNQAAVVLEYASAYDVHSPPEPGSTLPLRSQLGDFDTDRILRDLERHVDPGAYDFVLLYSLRELPGWIHSGDRNVTTPARNIGSDNCCYGAPPARPSWVRLRAAPHMNSLAYVAESGLHHALLVAAHEMAHFWIVRSARTSGSRECRPRGWRDAARTGRGTGFRSPARTVRRESWAPTRRAIASTSSTSMPWV